MAYAGIVVPPNPEKARRDRKLGGLGAGVRLSLARMQAYPFLRSLPATEVSTGPV
jgi:hypothetical protein